MDLKRQGTGNIKLGKISARLEKGLLLEVLRLGYKLQERPKRHDSMDGEKQKEFRSKDVCRQDR